ncbi:hypothetical protein N7G274_007200 [Stereocaulon virgatum]|uniref:Wax synthase domain-containing protein n=1 Tax=Stereocaulon virgatum TaxID=373712 RepID=A0ABR4A2Y7_9LECA
MLEFTNPIVFYLIENTLTIFVIAFAPPHHPARIVTFLLLLIYFYILFPIHLDRLHYRVLTSIVFGSSCANLLRYLDLVILTQWSFEIREPIPSLDSRAEAGSKPTDITGQNTKSTTEAIYSVSKSSQDGNVLERLRYGYFINAGPRLIGTAHMVKNVPPHCTSRASCVPSRAAFLVRKACIFGLCCLFLDLVTSGADPRNNACLFSADKIPLFRRWRDVDAEEVLRKVLGGVTYWVSAYCMIQCFMGAWAFVCVACGDDPKYWRPNFGSLSEGYSVRRFWG